MNQKFKVLIKSHNYYSYGDCLLVTGSFIIPVGDYYQYLLTQDIFAIYNFPEIEVLDLKNKLFYFDLINKIRTSFKNRVNIIFQYPCSSFVSGLLLGIRSEIPTNILDNFNRVGLTHILAISGYNISIIILFVFKLFFFFSRPLRIFFAIIFIILFVSLVGFSASVIRAAIMGVISLLAMYFGRSYSVIISLILSLFIMTLANPFSLLYDASLHLSFLATLGIICFADKLNKIMKFIPKIFLMRESLVMTLSAQVFVLPYVIIKFGEFSLISTLVNLFVLPFIPFLMFFSFFIIIISHLSNFFAVLLSIIPFFIMSFIFSLVEFFASFDFFYLQFDK